MAKKTPKDPSAPRKPSRPAMTNEDFVRAWQGCTSTADAKKLGLSSSRAKKLREAGVKLKALTGGRAPLDVAALNALCAVPEAKEE